VAKKLYYKIGEACKELDIQPYVLRYWETEFPALSPSKSKSGQRVYSGEDLELIRRIKELLYEEGYTIAGAKKKLESESPNRPRAVPDVAEEEDDVPEEDDSSAEEESGADEKAAGEEESANAEKVVPARNLGESKVPSKSAETGVAGELARLRNGISAALSEAREILDLLDSN
jgi:DNA-binding transcriptional MerR regulator